MFELILSLIISTILINANLPQVEPEFFIAGSIIELQAGRDAVYEGRLPRATNKPPLPQKIDQNSLGVEVTAQSGIVVDWGSGKVLWQKNSSQRRSIASLTKLMTALVFLDYNPGWEREIEILPDDQRAGGIAFFNIDEVVTTRDLFYISLIRSVNSAAVALARSTGLSEEEFISAMNQKAKNLGMNTSYFIEPTGLDTGNVSTAEDLIILIRESLSNNEIAEATTLQDYTATIINKREKRIAENTDWLIDSFLNKNPYQILGGKTGYLIEAGYSLGVGVERGEEKVISVILGSASIDGRFNDTKAVVEWVFRNYLWK